MRKIAIIALLIIYTAIMAFQYCNDSKENVVVEVTPEPSLPLRGINLGNALEAPNEGDWGVVLEDEYFSIIAYLGFDFVRIPVRWSSHALDEEPYTIDETFFERVDWAIENSYDNGLVAMINMHHYLEIMSEPEDQKERFLAMWEQISDRYKDYDNSMLWFELLNEASENLSTSLWNEYLNLTIQIIRETNPERKIVVGGTYYNANTMLANLELPDDENLIGTFHYYQPMSFTHQGASWVPFSDGWLGTTWDASYAEKDLISYDFSFAKEWSVDNNLPVILGEFGAYSKADMDSRVRWTSFVARLAEENGFAWSYWEFCSGYKIYDASTGEFIQELVDALIPEDELDDSDEAE